MDWIIKHKKLLISGMFFSAAIAVALMLYSREAGTIEYIEKWQLGLLVLPWVVFISCFFPLMYLSWFGKNGLGLAINVFKAFYWLLVSGFVVVFFGIYWLFVF